jgi:hypothetical protein
MIYPYPVQIDRLFHQNSGGPVTVASTLSASRNNTSIDNSASVSATLYHVPSLVYKIRIRANVCAHESTTVDRYSSGTHASASVSVDGSYASRHDNIIPITRAVGAGVHRVYRVSHLSSEI